MSDAYGISSDTSEYDDIIQGDAYITYETLDSTATCAKGQVLMWDASGNNFVDGTDEAAVAFAVCLETRTLGGDEQARVLRKGKVLKTALDSTSQSDLDLLQALVSAGILPVLGARV